MSPRTRTTSHATARSRPSRRARSIPSASCSRSCSSTRPTTTRRPSRTGPSVRRRPTWPRHGTGSRGLEGITIVDPSGLDPGSTGTVADVIRLGELALENPLVAEIVGTKSLEIHDIGTVKNTNALIGHEGIDGIKTGTLDTFGANLLFSATLEVGSHTVELVGVVLGGPDHPTINAAITDLVRQARAGFREVPLIQDGDPVAEYETPWDETASAVAGESASIVVWGDTAVSSTATVAPIRLGAKGDEVGTVVFTAGRQTVTVPLVLSRDVEDPGPWWRLGHPELIFGMR